MVLTYMCLLNIIHNQTMLQNFIKYLNLKKTVESSNKVYSFLHVYDVHCILISHQPRRDFWITSSTKLFKYSPVSLNISNLKYKCIHRSKITLNLLKLLFKEGLMLLSSFIFNLNLFVLSLQRMFELFYLFSW